MVKLLIGVYGNTAMRYYVLMTGYNRFINDMTINLVDAVRANEDLSEQEWAYLHSKATPYQRRVARLLVDPTAAPHGVLGTYTNWGCRCDLCSLAQKEARTTRTAAAPAKDFAEDHEGDDVPEQIARLKGLVEQGHPLTEKGKKLLDEWDAAHVI